MPTVGPGHEPRAAGRRLVVSGALLCLAVAAAACSSAPSSHPHPTTTAPPVTRPPVGGAVPAGFAPASASFPSASTGFVLGLDSACSSGSCVALARTTDGGTHWVGLPAPTAAYAPRGNAAPSSQTAVSEVRFADELDGWAYGPDLFATHDGGRTWQQVELGGAVVALAAADGVVDAVVSPCAADQSCTGAMRLEQAPTTGGAFTTVLTGPSATVSSGDASDLSLSSPVGFVTLGPSAPGTAALYATSDLRNVQGWHAFPDPCAAQGIVSLTAFAAPNTTTLYSLCSGGGAAGSSQKTVMVTRNGISTVGGSAPLGGAGGSLAATAAGALVIATASGASWLYRSIDGGQTWQTVVTFDDGGMGFNDLAFASDTTGVVVHGEPGPPGQESTQLLLSTDAGATWAPVAIG